MTNLSPSLDDWRALYEAAVAFKETKPWERMYDSDLFGVQDPKTGQIGYCCILGNLGEQFALVVYLGSEGLLSYLRILSNEDEADDSMVDNFVNQNCLIASFEDRKELEKPDLETIRQLGLRFRGRAAWPMFRSHKPGFFARPLTQDEARFLILALEQTLDVARRLEEDEDLLLPPREDVYLVRVPEQTQAALTWGDRWLEPQPLEDEPMITPQIDELRLKRIKNTAEPSNSVLEAHFFYSNFLISGEEEAPYYPVVSMFVEHDSGFILGMLVAPPWEYQQEFQEEFVSAIEKIQLLPKEVLVKKPEAFMLLEPVASALGIELTQVARLESLDQARIQMSRYMSSAGFQGV